MKQQYLLFLLFLLFLSAFVVQSKSHRVRSDAQRMQQWKQYIKEQQQLTEMTISPGENKFTIERPEGVRTYYVYVPKAYNESHAVPVLFGFHGLGDNCQSFADETGFKDEAESHNFLFVYPCATWGIIGTAWNAGTCCLNPSSVDDVEFTRLIIQDMQKNFNVDSSRIYTSGFSNGAMMSEILGCEAADLFAATASVAGVVELVPGNTEGETKCSDSYAKFNKAISTVNIHGTLDPLVPWIGDPLLGFPPIPDNFADWGKRNGCQGDPVETFKNGTFSNQIYQTCNNQSVVELIRHDGGFHSWPSTSEFDTTSYIILFFNL